MTPAQALKHPTWKMGNKITIDSSTLMNKGLEVIEAHWLFELAARAIDVVIHPQSIVHSMVEYIDGSVLAQIGIPDMSIPISYILAYPGAAAARAPAVARSRAGRAARVRRAGPRALPLPGRSPTARCEAQGTAPAVLNAANEVVVDAFLTARIGYLDIPRIARAVLDRHAVESGRPSLDAAARRPTAWARRAGAAALGAE